MVEVVRNRSLRSWPGVYRIRVACRLDQHWSERLQGMSVSVVGAKDGEAVTEICGELPDQAALMGVLGLLYDCGASLLSAERVGASLSDE